VVVLIADATQNAMASEYHSITEGASVIKRSAEEETRAERKRAVS
jgi:hypothetical protein